MFLSALGRDRGEYAAGVVLSGGDGDGTLGIKVIKELGGLTLAQVKDGHGPGHPSMPEFRFDPDQAEDLIAYLKSLER